MTGTEISALAAIAEVLAVPVTTLLDNQSS